MKTHQHNLFTALFLLIGLIATGQNKIWNIETSSPDGYAKIMLTVGEKLLVSVSYNGKEIFAPSEQGLSIWEFPQAFSKLKITGIKKTTVNETIIPVVAEKRSSIPNHYNQTEIWFKSNVGIRLVAYNDGVAWRFISKLPGTITIENEIVNVQMAKTDSVYFGEEDNLVSHSERLYPCLSVDSITEKQWCVLPAVFRKDNGVLAAFSESDLLDYPGLYFKGAGGSKFTGIFPNVVTKEKISKDKRSFLPEGRENYIARCNGTREFPWRLIGLAQNDAKLIENDIVYRLGSKLKIEETSWIKPGKVAWDWWNDWNLYDVTFKAGINTDSYKRYIDFASKYGLEYVIFDEGWSDNDDLDKINPEMDMEALFTYAAQKNVRIILWVTGRALEEKFDKSMEKFEKWGVAGLKVDFLIRDDQRMVNFYERVASEGAKRKMLVDFHGSYKPTGLSRAYPNQLTREGVKGLENNKWSDIITPQHDCTIPFTRMFAGPMDYTPGAMVNANKKDFKISYSTPMSMGTRCHELAKYVIFESPLQMLCDVPMNYEREPDVMKFLSVVPTTWDETIGINAYIGQYVTVARRKGNDWYIGSMTDWTPRSLDLKTDFLGEGSYELELWKDGPNVQKRAQDFITEKQVVDKNSTIQINLASGGGYVARFKKN